jgi:hypothetical protein
VRDDVSVDSETFLVTEFVNLKIKPVQSYEGAHRDRVCVCVYRAECSYVYEYLRLYCVSKKMWSDPSLTYHSKQELCATNCLFKCIRACIILIFELSFELSLSEKIPAINSP